MLVHKVYHVIGRNYITLFGKDLYDLKIVVASQTHEQLEKKNGSFVCSYKLLKEIKPDFWIETSKKTEIWKWIWLQVQTNVTLIRWSFSCLAAIKVQ